MYKLFVATEEDDQPIIKESLDTQELVEEYKRLRESKEVIVATLHDENGTNLNHMLRLGSYKK